MCKDNPNRYSELHINARKQESKKKSTKKKLTKKSKHIDINITKSIATQKFFCRENILMIQTEYTYIKTQHNKYTIYRHKIR